MIVLGTFIILRNYLFWSLSHPVCSYRMLKIIIPVTWKLAHVWLYSGLSREETLSALMRHYPSELKKLCEITGMSIEQLVEKVRGEREL